MSPSWVRPVGALSALVVFAACDSGPESADPFDVTAIDNDTVDGTRSATITATATAYFSGSTSIDITDHEEMSLLVESTRGRSILLVTSW